MKNTYLSILTICLFSLFTTQLHAQDDYSFFDLASWSITGSYDLDWNKFNGIGLRYESGEKIEIGVDRSDFFREKDWILKLDYTYFDIGYADVNNSSQDQGFRDFSEHQISLKIGKNLISYRKNKFRMALNSFIGFDHRRIKDTPINFLGDSNKYQYYTLGLSTELDFSYAINKNTAFRLSFPIPIYDIGLEKKSTLFGQTPGQTDTSKSIKSNLFNFNNREIIQFGFTKSF